jgi:hypothetical protein
MPNPDDAAMLTPNVGNTGQAFDLAPIAGSVVVGFRQGYLVDLVPSLGFSRVRCLVPVKEQRREVAQHEH